MPSSFKDLTIVAPLSNNDRVEGERKSPFIVTAKESPFDTALCSSMNVFK